MADFYGTVPGVGDRYLTLANSILQQLHENRIQDKVEMHATCGRAVPSVFLSYKKPRKMKEKVPESFNSDERNLYRGTGTIDDPFVVEWLPRDPQNPM